MLSFFIARHYFFSRRVKGIIHVISTISMLAVLVGSLALVSILSTFNGFENLVAGLYTVFEADVKITAARGKYFELPESKLAQIRALEGVKAVSPIIEDNAAVNYKDNTYIITLKGMEPGFLHEKGLDSMVYDGTPYLMRNGVPNAILGAGVAQQLDEGGLEASSPLHIYMPRQNAELMANPLADPTSLMVEKQAAIGGLFSVQQDFDNRYVLVPLSLARALTEQPEKMTAAEVVLHPGKDANRLKKKIAAILGPSFKVLDRYEQQPIVYKLMRNEKLVVYMVLSFVLLIASFNLVGALLMVATEKRRDLAVFLALGATPRSLRAIVAWQGLLLSMTGGLLGMGLGALIVWLQQQFGFITLGSNTTFVVSAYPVAMRAGDFLLVFTTVVVVGLLTALWPAFIASRRIDVGLLREQGAR